MKPCPTVIILFSIKIACAPNYRSFVESFNGSEDEELNKHLSLMKVKSTKFHGAKSYVGDCRQATIYCRGGKGQMLPQINCW